MERRLSAILAADVVGYSRLMGVDEAGTLAALKGHRAELIDHAISQSQGRIVKLTGDGILAEFTSVVNAVACAMEIQRGMAMRNAGAAPERRIELRIGVNIGDVIVEDGDIFGDGVNVAARLEGIAEPGGIAVSGAVRDQVGSRLDLNFEDRGEQALKNIERAVRVYAIALHTEAPASASDKAMPHGDDRKRRSIAVLPFTNMSGDQEQEYFSDGITEDLITDLSKISGLHVIARNTVFTYKGRAVAVQQAARELSVGFILEGSVRKAGQRIRVTGQLIDAVDGGHVWADRYDRDLTDIFAIQDEITRAIVDQLKIRLLPEEKSAIGRAPTDNVEAYTYYLRGRQFSREWTKSYLLLARRMFNRAIELDPGYARAYAGVADCDSELLVWHAAEVSLDTIMTMSAKALELDPSLAEAHASRGLALLHSGQFKELLAALERAIALDPDLHEAYFFSGRHGYMQGNFERAAAMFERAAAIRPDDYLSPMLLASVYRSLERRTERLKWAQIGIERAEKAVEQHPENSGPVHRGALLLADLGERQRALEWVARAVAIDPGDLVALYNIACVHSVLGNVEEAIDIMEKLLPHSSLFQLSWFKHDSDLDPIRRHPRYQSLVDTIERREGAGR